MKRSQIILLFILFYNGTVLAGNDEYVQASKAIQTDNLKRVSSILESGIDANEIPVGQGMSLLGLAVYFNREKIVNLLINSGATVIDMKGNNVLVLACATNKRNKKIIEALLNSGANINSVNSQNQSCLYSATISANFEFFNYLISKGANPDLVITPSPEIGPSNISIQELVNMRIDSYMSMKNRITSSSSERGKDSRQ